jgi:hypothetical protein
MQQKTHKPADSFEWLVILLPNCEAASCNLRTWTLHFPIQFSLPCMLLYHLTIGHHFVLPYPFGSITNRHPSTAL